MGGGIRSLNVALRQQLDLYVCLRPVAYFKGVPSPVREPEKTNMVIFRENSEDIYAGIEYMADSEQAKELIQFLQTKLGVKTVSYTHLVAVPLERGRLHLLHEDAEGAVLAAFHLVAHDGHFGIEVFLGDQGIDHGVGLPAQVPLEGVGVGGEAGEIVGAVAGGRAVGLQAAARELAHGVARGGGALEQHVFEPVSYTHLDVYKRQVQGRAGPAAPEGSR